MTGQKFNRLTVIKHIENYKCLCKCDCGNVKEISGNHLRSGRTKSCGCLKKEMTMDRNKTHGMSESKEYIIWSAMNQRCSNKNNKGYKYYGGRGIKVCKGWLKFENFYKDMGNKPQGLSLDRIDNSKGYCKENCRWATRKEQQRNTRYNKMIAYKGETKCLVEWSEELNMNYNTLLSRLCRYNMSIEKAFTKNVI